MSCTPITPVSVAPTCVDPEALCPGPLLQISDITDFPTEVILDDGDLVDYGEGVVDDPIVRTFRLRNIGGADLTILSIDVGGDAYDLGAVSLPVVLEPDEYIDVEVTFLVSNPV